MAEKNDTTGASPQAVDAYKTYLFRKGGLKVSQIEAIKPGQIIPIDDLNNDIAIVKKTIETVEKFGMPATEEKNKLKGLEGLKASLLGKPMAYLKAQEKAEKQKEPFFLPDPLAVSDPKGKPAKVSYNIKYQNPILLVKPEPVKKELSLSGAGAKFSQELIMRMGMLSNCNVLIYQTMGVYSKYGAGMALRCQHCGTERHLEDQLALVGTAAVFPEVEEFCKAHRHEPGVAEPTQIGGGGRMFRDED